MTYQVPISRLERILIDNPSFPLHAAVLHGDLPHIESLIKSGYNINTIEREDLIRDLGTPLHTAIWCNQQPAFELLLASGADMNIVDEGNYERTPDTPIRLAVRLGRRDIFKTLWDVKAMRNKWPSGTTTNTHRPLLEIASWEG